MKSESENSIAINNELLQQLFAKLGIEHDFSTYKGERHVASEAVRIQLIRAMGYQIEDDYDALMALQQIDWEPWQPVLQAFSYSVWLLEPAAVFLLWWRPTRRWRERRSWC